MYWIPMFVLTSVGVSCFLEAINKGRKPECSFSECDTDVTDPACGIRTEDGGVRLRVFENECKLQKYGCGVSGIEAYRSVSMDYCATIFADADADNDTEAAEIDSGSEGQPEATNLCDTIQCSLETSDRICALRKDGDGYRVRLFESRCGMLKHNCVHGSEFNETDSFVCQDLEASSDDEVSENLLLEEPVKADPEPERVIVINARSVKYRSDLNGSVEEFFAATHKTPLPLDLMPLETRRNIVLKKCPETYTPVCGVPGVAAREPSLIFQNHCFMDKAQCKMFWENKSPTAESSNYVEGSFIFCLGDELTSLYRFLPLIKSLQRMGRLKQRGHFRYKLRNLRFVNNIVVRNPKIMG